MTRQILDTAQADSIFHDASTILTGDEIRTNLEIQRFPREERDTTAASGIVQIAQAVGLFTNFEMHRRKTFWVDESLAYMLAKTDLDVTGGEVRFPFACFALVFTDRYTLSFAERMLSMEKVSGLARPLPESRYNPRHGRTPRK